MYILKNIYHKKLRLELIISKADKRNCLILSKKSYYVTKVEQSILNLRN